jgi:D-alanine-D-alanine ligase-like ATP-grasp enzyme
MENRRSIRHPRFSIRDLPSCILDPVSKTPMKKKLRVAILFGGSPPSMRFRSYRQRNIVEANGQDKYDVVAIGIDKQGRWHLDEERAVLHGVAQSEVAFKDAKNSAAVRPGDHARRQWCGAAAPGLGAIDVVFLCCTGPSAKTAPVQGLLQARQYSLCRRRPCWAPLWAWTRTS